MQDQFDSVGRRVRSLRFERALSQAELASQAGLARYVIIRLEQGEPVHPRTIRKVAHALGVEPMAITIGS